MADVPQEFLLDDRRIDSSARDIEEKKVDEVHDEDELPSTGLVGRGTCAELRPH